ncbi:MAG: hemolysin family protein [Phaeospirillum sp.]|nr:hemolysin family protein [Phaeospirillum sp.]
MNDPGSIPPRDSGANGKKSQGGQDESLLRALRGWIKARRRPKGGGETVREALEELIEDSDSAEVPIDDHERLLLGNILHLRGVTANDVSVPRADIVAVESKVPLDDLIKLFIECGHSRLPVYRRTLDDVIGMVHIKDLLEVLGLGKPFNLPRMVRRVQFVAPSMRVTDLLLEMRLKRAHLAMVVDEYGGIDGLVTIEDLVEQIVGEIEDEHDQAEEPDMVDLPDGAIEADARTAIAEFEDKIGNVLTEEEREEVETLGGLVFFVAGRVPSRGELITHSAGLEFEVLDADPRRVKRVRVRRTLPPSENKPE